MPNLTLEQLNKIIESHGKWLRNEKGGTRADLYRADLSGVDLSEANLSGVDLSEANLSGADLSEANLSGADLYRANLSGADLSGADLYRANLYRANLSGADLYRANLYRANLSGADLSGVDLDKKYVSISPIGSRKGLTTYCIDDDKIWCGCFEGTLIEFEAKVNETHSNNPQYLAEYLGAIGYFKKLIEFHNNKEAPPECKD